MRNLIHWNGPHLLKQVVGALVLAFVLACIFPALAAVVFIAILAVVAWWIYEDQVNRKAQVEANIAATEQARQDQEELDRLSKIPTSSSGNLRGYRVAKQLRAISVDNFKTRVAAELDFFRQVKACGGSGVINMRTFRRRGGYIAITGDAVLLE